MIPRFPKKPVQTEKTSSVLSFHHDPETKTLEVTFHGGRSYRYDNVSAENVAKLKAAKSKGAFLNEHIIPHHTFIKLKGDRTATGPG